MSKLQINLRGGAKTEPLNELRGIITLIFYIFIYAVFIIGSTYAFMNFNANNDDLLGQGGCFEVSYTGEEINSLDILSSDDYKNGAKTSVTLSKSSSCKIYSMANIYIHTSDETTAPIASVSALKYKVVTSDNYERNGIINKKGDLLIANVPLNDTSTTYKVYIWVDSSLSSGAFNNTSYSGYIYADAIQTSTIDTDTKSPSLFLYKESTLEGFDGWSLTNSTITSGTLNLGTSGTSGNAESPYINVNGEKWSATFEGYTTGVSTSYTPDGGVLLNSSYYNSNKVAEKSIGGYTANGWAHKLTLNTWTSNLSWDGYTGYGPNIKYLQLKISTGNQYSQPITQIRNFKIIGQVDGSFYDITVRSADDIGVITTKYAKGIYDKNYFINNGLNVVNNTIRVTENGTYTFYVADAAGNNSITTIDITNII